MKGKEDDNLEKVEGELVEKKPGVLKKIIDGGKDLATSIYDTTSNKLSNMADTLLTHNKEMTQRKLDSLTSQIEFHQGLIDREHKRENPNYQYINDNEEIISRLNKEFSEVIDKANEDGLNVFKTLAGTFVVVIGAIVSGGTYMKKK